MKRSPLQFNIRSCSAHGLFACHVNGDGTHVDPRLCTCARDPKICPIDLHKGEPDLFRALTEAEMRDRELSRSTIEHEFDFQLENYKLRNMRQEDLF